MLVNIAHIRKVNDLREAARRIASARDNAPVKLAGHHGAALREVSVRMLK
jgi:hypothetical protein